MSVFDELQARTRSAREHQRQRHADEEAAREEVRSTIAQVFERDFKPELLKAADEGKSEASLLIGTDEDSEIARIRIAALIESLSVHLESLGLQVQNRGVGAESHCYDSRTELFVSWENGM
jgi:hypothetical protein